MHKKVILAMLMLCSARLCWVFNPAVHAQELSQGVAPEALRMPDPCVGDPAYDEGDAFVKGKFLKVEVMTGDGDKLGSDLQAAVEADNPSHPIETTLGEEFTLTLASNPTTGYQWQLAEPLLESLVKWVGNRYVPPESRLVGSGGKEIWTFKAVGRGKTSIAMKYVRPWEKNIPPVEQAVFSVEIR